jgi:hypothetical protein
MKYVRTYTSVYIPGAAHLVYRAAPASVPLFPKRQCDVTLRPVTDMGCCPRQGVRPVTHTRGGSSRGYERWQAFKVGQRGAGTMAIAMASLAPPCSLHAAY